MAASDPEADAGANGMGRPGSRKLAVGAGVVRVADRSGTLVHAMEGALAGIAAGFDPIGVMVLAFVSALGGGIIRDLVIGVRPAAISGGTYAGLVLVGAVATWCFYPFVGAAPEMVVMLIDAAGLGLFVVAGTEKALDHGVHPLPAVFLGTVGAVGGGVIRDVLLNVAPRILHTDIYASAAILGAVIVVLGRLLRIDPRIAAVAGGLACFVVRVMGYDLGWQLPHLVAG